ncbi:hypothetical protein EVG20_g9091 [Dentipellis fragilis]|uniref:Xylanolytic transcriptional activator regulatory domain-containing protein n=1 Tax=Dentipellis fragilis TaxID=205917 RepID=A0A4Y9Y1S0_9AGAM|nr:hypothetical protein EVG20_g9091 [Dentipellis fragilis]
MNAEPSRASASTDGKASGDSVSGAASRDRKSGLSCAECRRVFPCQSCIRRGCSAICPDGTLAATKGNKVLMAHAQKLSQQVKSMSARIKELEQALAETQAGTVHPLLRELHGQGTIGSAGSPSEIAPEEVDALSDIVGSLSIGSDGRSRYHGETAGAEYLRALLPETDPPAKRSRDPRYLGIPADFVDLAHAFPFGLRDTQHLHLQFTTFIPPRERAEYLANLYFINNGWLFDVVPRKELKKEFFDQIYASDGTVSLLSVHAHRLSVFFSILATGVYHDTHPSAALLSDQYHALACASFSTQPIAREASIATVQALFLVILFLWMSDRSTNELRWLMSGLIGKLIQTLGIQRDSANWDIEPEEIQHRRRVFWEYFGWECWLSIVNGRPPTLALEHSDCRFPEDDEPFVRPSGEVEMGWYAVKNRFIAECLAATVTRVFKIKRESYSSLLELHNRIRNFPVAVELQCPIEGADPRAEWSPDQARTMQQCCLFCLREACIIYIHRSYLAHALKESPNDPSSHKYAKSVLASYKSARNLMHGLRGAYAAHPRAVGRFWFFWTAGFSACFVTGVLITESPGCSIATTALPELNDFITLYEEASAPCRPVGTVAVLLKLQKRAYNAYMQYHKIRDPIPTTQDQAHPSDIPDDIEVMGFKKQFIKESPSHSPHSNSDRSSPPMARGHDAEANDATMSALCPDAMNISAGASSSAQYGVQGQVPMAQQSRAQGPGIFPQSDFRSTLGGQAGPSRSIAPQPTTTSSFDSPSPFTFDNSAALAAQFQPTSAPSWLTPPQAQTQDQRIDGLAADQMDSQLDFLNTLMTGTSNAPPGSQDQDNMWWNLVQDLGLTS